MLKFIFGNSALTISFNPPSYLVLLASLSSLLPYYICSACIFLFLFSKYVYFFASPCIHVILLSRLFFFLLYPSLWREISLFFVIKFYVFEFFCCCWGG